MKPFGAFSLWLIASTLPLAAIDLQTLVNRSPFAPPQASVDTVSVAEPGTLEFRGMVVDEAGTAYSVFDATANRGYWLRDGADGPFRVKNYNAQDSLLEIEQNGRPVKLQLKRATIQAGTAVVAAPRPTGQPGTPAVNPNAPADARRLEAVAAEVRRRRALRNAATPATPGQTPPPAQTP